MKINCLHPEAQFLYYNCHLRYIFNYALKDQIILVKV